MLGFASKSRMRLQCCFLLSTLVFLTLCRANAAEEAGKETADSDRGLELLSSHELSKLETSTLESLKQSEEQLSRLRNETEVLKNESKTISKANEKLLGAKDWENEEKRKRDEQLQEVKHDVERKQKSIDEMKNRVTDLKSRIDELKSHLSNLTSQKETVARRNDAPTIREVLDARAESWNPMAQKVYRKTRDKVIPAISGVTGVADKYRRSVASSPLLDFIASVLLYGFFVVGLLMTMRVYNRVRGHFTVARLLFLGDSFCAMFWGVMLLCYSFLWTDPLVAIQSRTPNLFFVFQLGALVAYVLFVLLRVLMLASKLTFTALGETLAVVIVGHHYYVRVWQPSMMDTPIHGALFYYICYAWLFMALAKSRINEFAPLKQLRGQKLPPLVALRVLMNRFSSNGPQGDLESSLVREDDDEGHEH